ncbi:MAG TPA: DMT family transporter [Nocardioidaceae bacterium]|nr:DMT family transporter [Nocardioidaceae bacterium]
MSGAAWAALSGIGFGVFQVLNARAVRNLNQIYLATFVQLVAATAVFVVIVGFEGNAGDLARIPASSLIYFALSGMFHFFLGWTTLNQSQVRIGAARTSPLIATSPIFGLFIALVTTGAVPGPVALVGIALTVFGAYIVTDPGPEKRAALRDSAYGLTTSAAWALSAIFTVAGLRGFDDPLLGVTVGMAAAGLAYGAVLLVAATPRDEAMDREAWALKILAGIIVALATWSRWLGLADAPVGVVLALQLLTVPTVLLIVALKPGGEKITLRVWLGAAFVVAGVCLLIAVP